MSDIAIRVDNLGKQYRIGRTGQRHDTLRDTIADFARHVAQRARPGTRSAAAGPPSGALWALKNVSFEVKRGEVLGIIGRNGAGKTTLLKVLSRITEPTTGQALVTGRVGSLLEVGTGFHPELTGRENIYLNGAILGMKKREIDRKFDEIVAFAEIENFLDTPVKRYSSGMYVRLAFAVAAHLEPEILLVDEVLAVGDAAFQKKCLGKMEGVAKEGRTVLFVSHNMAAVGALCGAALRLEKGQLVCAGPVRAIVADYLAEVFQPGAVDLTDLRRPGFGDLVRFSAVRLLSGDESTLFFGQPIEYALDISSSVSLDNLRIGSSIFNASGYCIGSLITRRAFSVKANQSVRLKLLVSHLNLAPGRYYAGLSIGRGGQDSHRQDYDVIVGAPAFQVVPISSDQSKIADWSAAWGDLVLEDTELLIEES